MTGDCLPSRFEHARAAEGFALLIQMLEELGFRVHPTKRSPPSQIMEYTGLVYNSIEGTVSAPSRKVAKALFVINECLNTSHTVVHTLDKVTGTLSDLASVFTHHWQVIVVSFIRHHCALRSRWST